MKIIQSNYANGVKYDLLEDGSFLKEGKKIDIEKELKDLIKSGDLVVVDQLGKSMDISGISARFNQYQKSLGLLLLEWSTRSKEGVGVRLRLLHSCRMEYKVFTLDTKPARKAEEPKSEAPNEEWPKRRRRKPKTDVQKKLAEASGD